MTEHNTLRKIASRLKAQGYTVRDPVDGEWRTPLDLLADNPMQAMMHPAFPLVKQMYDELSKRALAKTIN